MSVQLSQYSNMPDGSSCVVCHESFNSNSGAILAHDTLEGHDLIHPAHEDCFTESVGKALGSAKGFKCPECPAQINPDSIKDIGILDSVQLRSIATIAYMALDLIMPDPRPGQARLIDRPGDDRVRVVGNRGSMLEDVEGRVDNVETIAEDVEERVDNVETIAEDVEGRMDDVERNQEPSGILHSLSKAIREFLNFLSIN